MARNCQTQVNNNAPVSMKLKTSLIIRESVKKFDIV
jgi:hypothetical protein